MEKQQIDNLRTGSSNLPAPIAHKEQMEQLNEFGYRVTDQIYISSEYEANNPEWLKENDISAILNVSMKPDYDTGGIPSYWLGFPDRAATTDDEIIKAVKALRYLSRLHSRVLVHCAAGVSRSPLVVAIYLALERAQSFRSMIDHVREGRHCTNPNLNFMGRGQSIVDGMRSESE